MTQAALKSTSSSQAIGFYSYAPYESPEQRAKLVARPKQGGRMPTGGELLDALLTRFKLRDASISDGAGDAPQRVDADRTWLLRNATRGDWVPLEDSIDSHVAEDDTLELYDRSVAGTR